MRKNAKQQEAKSAFLLVVVQAIVYSGNDLIKFSEKDLYHTVEDTLVLQLFFGRLRLKKREKNDYDLHLLIERI